MRRTWTWTFDLPPDELWPPPADTNRFNGCRRRSKVRYALEWEPLTFMGRLFGARLAAQAGEIVAKAHSRIGGFR